MHAHAQLPHYVHASPRVCAFNDTASTAKYPSLGTYITTPVTRE